MSTERESEQAWEEDTDAETLNENRIADALVILHNRYHLFTVQPCNITKDNHYFDYEQRILNAVSRAPKEIQTALDDMPPRSPGEIERDIRTALTEWLSDDLPEYKLGELTYGTKRCDVTKWLIDEWEEAEPARKARAEVRKTMEEEIPGRMRDWNPLASCPWKSSVRDSMKDAMSSTVRSLEERVWKLLMHTAG